MTNSMNYNLALIDNELEQGVAPERILVGGFPQIAQCLCSLV